MVAAVAPVGLEQEADIMRLVTEREIGHWEGRSTRLRVLTVVCVVLGLGFLVFGVQGERNGWSLAVLTIVLGAMWVALGVHFEMVRRALTRPR
jgi:Zn-dependent protease with chaperone function